MQLAPLQLLHYHFVELSIATSATWSPEDSNALNGAYPSLQHTMVELDVALGEPDDTESPKDFIMVLGIIVEPKEGEKFPYSLRVKLEGHFEIDHDGDLEERKRLVLVNGASMLFGAVRDQVLGMSSRSKFGPLLLPSVSFRGMQLIPPEIEVPEKSGPVIKSHAPKKKVVS